METAGFNRYLFIYLNSIASEWDINRSFRWTELRIFQIQYVEDRIRQIIPSDYFAEERIYIFDRADKSNKSLNAERKQEKVKEIYENQNYLLMAFYLFQ